jgi:hypothetical protein
MYRALPEMNDVLMGGAGKDIFYLHQAVVRISSQISLFPMETNCD